MDSDIWKILVVEDDEDDYFLTRELLGQTHGRRYKFSWARTAAAARASLQNGGFDVALMDERLPDGSGLNLIREAVATGLRAPVIMLTGQGSYELDLEAMRSGAADYLSKNEVTGPLLERAIRYAIERKQAETERERLMGENERQRNLLDSILQIDPGGIALVSGPDLTYQFANPAYRIQIPHPEIDPVGQPYARVWQDDATFLSADTLRQVLASGQPAHLSPTLRVGASGAPRSFIAHAYPVAQVDPSAVLLVMWEVATARENDPATGVSAAETQRQIEEMGSIFSTISHAMIVFDVEGKPLYANPAAAAALGFNPTGLSGKEFLERVIFRTREGEPLNLESRPVTRALAGEVISGQHLYVSGAGGDEHLVIVSAAPLHRGDILAGAVVIWHPFSEHELSEGELRAAEARMEGLLQALPVAVWIVDAQGRIISRNEPADRLWAGDAPVPEHFERYGAYKLLDPDTGAELPAEARPLERAILSGEVTNGQRYRIQRLDGSTGVVLAFAGPIQVKDGETLGGVVIDLDITEQDRLEKINLEQKRELERSNQDLQDFASIVSHDLKEPLRKITGFGELLVRRHKEELGEEGQDYIGRMTSAAERMQRMIDALLTYSRVSTRGLPFEVVDLNQVTNEVLEDLDLRIEQTGGVVEVGQLPTIQADPSQIKHLLQNLIGNALKFHRADVHSKVKVQARSLNDKQIELTVADNGIGFDEQSLRQIFLPFSRLHGRGEYEGSGMGLAICRKIAERHSGSITARSQPGEGSTFIVVLPRRQPKK